MKNYKLLLILLFYLGITACSKDKMAEPDLPPPQVDIKIENFAYGEHARQKMDVFLPKTRSKDSPILLIIHGGFWTEGDKSDFSDIQKQLFAMGIASVNMNYRYVSPTHDVNGLMSDIRQAIDKMKTQSSDWNISLNSLHLAGYSAGGHMALLYGYHARRENEVKSVISISGPTVFDEGFLNSPLLQNPKIRSSLEWLTGAPIPDHALDPNFEKYRQASPYTHCEKAVPTLFIHGINDEIVPYRQSWELKYLLEYNQITSKLITLQGAGHDVSTNPLHIFQILIEVPAWIQSQK